ncbi:hypothetical protein A3SI_02583 [Nitritalea halalkaliphila LW7]|uniref:DUF4304 domain-containing protein n=1 Tax=Nitritalea halalkaliphila LW7 TaxID=1189621 RepID=I5C9P9_9BACT|nr:hypothetical protein [Nitritalea halalkaliphila]EIM78551.1 hypothetical protein A3SI_02583 [Nitritalea halalkaliphila LW7]
MDQIEDFLTDFGFSYDKDIEAFTKPTAHGRQVVLHHHIKSDSYSYLEFHLGIRIKEVEETIYTFLPSFHQYRQKSFTYISPLDHVDAQMPRRQFINHPGELALHYDKFERFMVYQGFRWLDRHEDPEVLTPIFLDKIHLNLQMQAYVNKACRALTLAAMCAPEDFHRVKEQYLEQLKRNRTPVIQLKQFDSLHKHLTEKYFLYEVR